MDYLGVIEKEIGIFGDSIDNLSYHLSLFSITRRCSTLELLECIIFNIIQLFPFTLRKAENPVFYVQTGILRLGLYEKT